MSRRASDARSPALSVVVAASDSVAAVARTLAALGRQRGAGDLEIIVAAARDRVRCLCCRPGHSGASAG